MLTSIAFTTTLLTINHLYLIVVLPLASTNPIPATDSLNVTHVLEKRQWYPITQLCQNPEEWVARECVGGKVFDRAWRNECVDHDGDVDYDWGECPVGSVCVDTIHSQGDRLYQTITCINHPDKEAQQPNTSSKPPPTGQCGVQVVSGAYTLRPAVCTVPIEITQAISGAAITSFIEGTDQPYPVKPNSPMSGKLRRTKKTVCIYNESNGDCVPNGPWDLRKGDFIDFKFGLGSTQVVNFYYALLAGG